MAWEDGFLGQVPAGGCGEGGILAQELEETLCEDKDHWAAYSGICGVWSLGWANDI